MRKRGRADDGIAAPAVAGPALGPEVSILRLPWWASAAKEGRAVVGVELVPRLLLKNGPQHLFVCRWFRVDPSGPLHQVGSSLCYTPASGDVGCALRVTCAATREDGAVVESSRRSVETGVVLACPALPPPDRRLVGSRAGDDASDAHGPKLQVVSYNILADCLASENVFPYTPPWALRRTYRQAVMLAELAELAEGTDLLCLQEVTPDAFDALRARLVSFEGVLDIKRHCAAGGPRAEGVATFWRASRLELAEHACEALSEWALRGDANLAAGGDGDLAAGLASGGGGGRGDCVLSGSKLGRDLCSKGHVVQLLALAWKGTAGAGAGQDRCGLCVGNTHLHWSPAQPHLKAAQASAACHALSAFRGRVASGAGHAAAAGRGEAVDPTEPAPRGRDDPELSRAQAAWLALLCGDMNSLPVTLSIPQPGASAARHGEGAAGAPAGSLVTVEPAACALEEGAPGSGTYTLLRTGRLASDHADHPSQAGSGGCEPGDAPAARQPLRLRSAYERVLGVEPDFTNFTADFVGTIDYIWYETSGLQPLQVLRLPERQTVSSCQALPSPVFPSDHLPLLASFALRPDRES